MSTADLIDLVRVSPIFNSFFHFTDGRNIAEISSVGLLSMRELQRRQAATVTGGNEWSLDADRARGLDSYVHLCMRNRHPMEYVASNEGRIQDVRWLKIDPVVLTLPGVMMTLVVSNQAGSELMHPDAAIPQLDLEVLYTKTDWKTDPIKERLRIASKYEILVPDHVPLRYITF